MNTDLIMAYDDLFIGLTDRLPTTFFSSSINPKILHVQAIDLFRYAFDHILHWSPTVVRDYLTMEVINDLKLMPVFRHIIFPDGLVREESLFYIAWLAYPQTVNKRIQDVELETYHKYLNKEIKKLPTNYFSGSRSVERACNCLIDRINYYQPFQSSDPFYAYEFFVSPGCVPFLGKSRLIKIVIALNTTPLDYFHQSLKQSQRCRVIYNFFKFMLQYNPMKDASEIVANVHEEEAPIFSEEDI